VAYVTCFDASVAALESTKAESAIRDSEEQRLVDTTDFEPAGRWPARRREVSAGSAGEGVGQHALISGVLSALNEAWDLRLEPVPRTESKVVLQLRG
jgi:hypothetical protein